MRQVPRSPLSFKLQRVANVPEHPPPSTRLMSCAHIANRRLSRIIGASSFYSPSTAFSSLAASLASQYLRTISFSFSRGSIPSSSSSMVCRLATGGGFAVRQLYTDQDEVLFDA